MRSDQPPPMRDWKTTRAMWVKTLETKTGHDLTYWKALIAKNPPANQRELQQWLETNGVTGYGAQVLVMEHFGYPEFLEASGGDLIDAQYKDRQPLRAIYEAIVEAAGKIGPIVIQARKGYVSLLSPKTTFARIQATTKTRVDLGLRLKQKPRGRLLPGKIHETMPVQLALSSVSDLDAEAVRWLRHAYDETQRR